MKQFGTALTGMGFALVLATGFAHGQANANVGGTVRDIHGTPLMGALVELLGPDASVLSRAFTDDHGHYLLQAIGPGTYQLQATAAFLLPVHRANFQVRAGVHAVANLTMTAIFDSASWLPVEKRLPGEPSDDWQWTLRSTANRPLLRMVDDAANDDAGANPVADRDISRARTSGHFVLTAGDGRFGEGGLRQVLTLEHTDVAGSTAMVAADLGASIGPPRVDGSRASSSVAAGFERKSGMGAGTRLLVSVAAQPVVVDSAPASLTVLRSAATQTIAVGDAFIVDAGTLFTAEKLFGDRYRSAPYVRVAVRPSADWTVEYRFASDRHLQTAADLDHQIAPDEVLADTAGMPIPQHGSHQELAVARGDAQRSFRIGVFRDNTPVAVLQGAGLNSGEALAMAPALSDPTTATFHLAAQGFSGQGAIASWSQAVSPAVRISLQGVVGRAIEAEAPAVHIEALGQETAVHTAVAMRAAVDLTSQRFGSSMLIRYRWQPPSTLTAVDPFDMTDGDAYLGFALRQRLVHGRRLGGVDAVVQATNLLAQGYEPLLGADGRTLYLAQVPRGLTAGLSFTF